MKEEENNTPAPPVEELELETPTPTPTEELQDNIADILTSKELEKTVSKIVDEKISLAQTATDDEELLPPEEEEEDEKGMGLFPTLLIGGVVLVGIVSFFLNYSPTTSPTSPEENLDG